MASAAAPRMSLLRNAKTTLQLLKSPILNRSGKTDIKPLLVSATKSRGGVSSLFNTDDNTIVDKSERVVGDAVLFWKTGFLNHSDVMVAARGRKPAVDSDSDMSDYDGDDYVVDDDDVDDDDDDESEQLGWRR